MAKLDIVTVVFAAEMELLRLQARSFARHLPAEIVGHILVVVNDIDPVSVAREVENLRSEYGPLQHKLRIVQPEDVISRPRSLKQRLMRLHMRQRRMNRNGWWSFGGWHVQQFLKLLAAREASSDYLIIVDAKNTLMKDVVFGDFVDGKGRPRTYDVLPTSQQWSWVCGSYEALGFRPPDTVMEVTPTVTPVVYGRVWMLTAIEYLESKLGPLEYYFTMKKKDTTEFMLVHAYAEIECGGFRNVFGDGLTPPTTIFSAELAGGIENKLTAAARGECVFFAVHRLKYAELTNEQADRLCQAWQKAGIVSDLAEGQTTFARLAALSAKPTYLG